MAAAIYPVQVDASLDRPLSRWLWLVKWFLAIPHYVVLSLLWMAFTLLSAFAFFAILFTGRYPRSVFEFNVGVLRWTWRVHYYAFGALGTDRYPPFALRDVAGYPAHLEITYPSHLSRGLVLVKWWLLAIPHYIVVGLFLGGGTWAAWRADNHSFDWAPAGLIGLLVLVAAVVLMFTGRYPQQIFDFVLGMNRWVLRVAAYAGLMTDAYPPFRLDMGGQDPGGTLTVSGPSPLRSPTGSVAWQSKPMAAPPKPTSGWTAGRIGALVAGIALGVIALGLLGAGGVATWADHTQRDAAGYLTSGVHTFRTTSYALTSDAINLGTSADVVTPSDFFGTVRIRVTAAQPNTATFIGIAPRTEVGGYLAGTSHEVVTDWANDTATYLRVGSGAPNVPPTAVRIWAAKAFGIGTQTLTWAPQRGNWAVVVMNADGGPGVSVKADAGAAVPDLGGIGVGLLAGGVAFLAAGAVLITVPVVRASR
jgi:hypothetical protein